MRIWIFRRAAFGICAAALLAACGVLQPAQDDMPSINAPGAGMQSRVIAAPTKSTNFKIVYSFGAAPDGNYPAGPLIDVHGTLYGTTIKGGDYGGGTAFSITQSGVEKVLHSFGSGSDGSEPSNALLDARGTLYGTTHYGGTHTCYLSSYSFNCGTVFSITPGGTEAVLHSFAGGSDGSVPITSLIDVKATLYGTTYYGGYECHCGTVFSITPRGVENVLHSFSSGSSSDDGINPSAGLLDVHGTLYGTTQFGGSNCRGSSNYGCGTVFSITTGGVEEVVHSFGAGSDGVEPTAALINVKGTLYGTTEWAAGCDLFGSCGTVFSITPGGTEKVLHTFHGAPDGGAPVASLIDVNGTLYGTTYGGGDRGCDSGCGTVFSITPSGAEKVLHRFVRGAGGYYPDTALIDVNGTLYGTTFDGGTSGNGTVFALTP
jgi:uncharacterized repeat protein (TIGR03803 family)